MNRTPEIKITERNVTGMRYVSPNIWVRESAKLIMIVALVGIVAMLAVAAGA